MKICSRCGLSFSLKDFHFHKGMKDGLYPQCKKCKSESAKIYYLNLNKVKKEQLLTRRHGHYEANKVQIKNYYYLREYGISIEDYNRRFKKQSGCCVICGIHQSELDVSLSVDHDHETGIVRGLLCRNCNTLLGHSHDDPQILENAITYLKQFQDGS